MDDAIDPAFLTLPLKDLAGAALGRAADLGAADASVHVVRNRTARMRARDGSVQAGGDELDTALGVRLVHDGRMGYASTVDLTPAAAVRVAELAVGVAKACRPLRGVAGRADEPVYTTVWASAVEEDPFDVPWVERAALISSRSHQVLKSPIVEHVVATFAAVRENRFYADSAGTTAIQQRVRVHPMLTAFGAAPRGRSVSLRTSAPPVARGWEYLTGSGWDWDTELAELPSELEAKSRSRPVKCGTYDVVIDASNLWLTIHETVGHASELDRALGYEATYAGTTFVAPEAVGQLRFGSELMNVTADRVTEHGLATIGIDDEGVAAQSWDLVRDGVLVGLQTDRHTAAVIGAARSTGCSFAESALVPPLTRMPNVSLQAPADGPDVAALIAGIEDGIYFAGADSWSIDHRREHFQFTAQRCRRIRAGRLVECLSGAAYRGSTTRFWASLVALGGPATYGLFGADLCGKGQPMQAAPTSHGCPAAVFSGVCIEYTGNEVAR
jgi:TldD protein